MQFEINVVSQNFNRSKIWNNTRRSYCVVHANANSPLSRELCKSVMIHADTLGWHKAHRSFRSIDIARLIINATRRSAGVQKLAFPTTEETLQVSFCNYSILARFFLRTIFVEAILMKYWSDALPWNDIGTPGLLTRARASEFIKSYGYKRRNIRLTSANAARLRDAIIEVEVRPLVFPAELREVSLKRDQRWVRGFDCEAYNQAKR